MLENLYTTKMSANKKTLQNRFTKIRRKSGRISKIMAAVMSCAVAVTMLGGAVVMAAVTANYENQNKQIKYEVYNGNKLISLTNTPIIYGDSYYLPLRETLNAFGINDIQWDGGKITISMPHSQKEGFYADKCEIAIGSDYITYSDGPASNRTMSAVPILQDGITYVSEFFFEDLMRVGQIPNFRFNVIRDLAPEAYYKPGEEVFIGTLAQQERFSPDTPVKRIITDENGNTVAVVTVENQQPQKLNSLQVDGDIVNAGSYGELFNICGVIITADGKHIYKNNGIIIYNNNNDRIAFIPVTWQINIPKADFSALNNQIDLTKYR